MSPQFPNFADRPQTTNAEALARANAVLTESVRRLSASDDTSQLLDGIVEQVAELIEARCVFLLEYSSTTDTLTLLRTWLDGNILVGPRGDELELFSKPFPTNISRSWQLMCADRGMVTGSRAPTLGVTWPGAAEFMARIEATDCGRIALFIGDEPVGCLAFAVSDGRELPTDDRNLIETISRQAAVAIKLVKQADASKKAAVSRERELSARDNAETLQRLNEILIRGAERVDRTSDLRDALIGFLLEAKRTVGAFYAAAYRAPEGTRHVPIAVVIEDSSLSDKEIVSSGTFERFEERSADAPSGFFSRLSRGEFVSLKTDEFDPHLSADSLAYHRSIGNQVIWHFPLMLRGKSCGYVALGMQRDALPSEKESEQLVAIQMHLSLAMEMQRLAKQVEQAAIIEERNRLARDIHDTLAQGALGVILHLESMSQFLSKDPTRAEQAIALVLQLARNNLDDARRAIGLLRGDSQHFNDLASRISGVVRLVNAESDDSVDVRLECPTTVPAFTPERTEQIVRIIAEALKNAKRHASANSITVRLDKEELEWTVRVTDNGCGFDPNIQPNEHYGLLGMRERAVRADCILSIRSELGVGTNVMLSWPVE